MGAIYELPTIMTKLGHTKIHVLKCERWYPAVLCLSTLCRRPRGISADVSPCGGLRGRLRDLTDADGSTPPSITAWPADCRRMCQSQLIVEEKQKANILSQRNPFFMSMIKD